MKKYGIKTKNGNLKRNMAVGVVFLALVIAVIVYIYAKDDKGIVPPMPKVILNKTEISNLLSHQKQRAAAFLPPTEIENKLIEKMYIMNKTEAEGGKQAERNVFEYREIAKRFAAGNRQRYLLMGDYFAVQFQKYLFEIVEKMKSQNVDFSHSDSAWSSDLTKVSGSFLKNAMKKGLIASNGTFLEHAILPVVLFKRRWRLLGGLPIDDGLSKIEKIAGLDYDIRYRNKKELGKRISAINALKANQSAYDDKMALAIIFYEANKNRKAKKILDTLRRAGRKDPMVLRFSRYLDRILIQENQL